MWMIKNCLILAVMFVAFAMVASSPANAQGTPDGETPANEGVCDELIGATPGLYGLCVGFCEAQDCRPTLDAMGELTFDHCNPSSPRLLENYKKRMQPGDPSMPCVAEGECPCWTEAELETLGGVSDECADDGFSTAIGNETELAFVFGGDQCFLQWDGGDGPPIRFQFVTNDEYLFCGDSIRAECEHRGIPLLPPAD